MSVSPSRRLFIGGLAAVGLPGLRSDDEAAFVAWARTQVEPVRIDGLDAIASRLARGSRVIALGEPAHGAAEPLRLRNALVRALLARGTIDAVALESGTTEGRLVNAFVSGGPGDARSVAAQGITWGFANLADNISLIEMLRAYNRTARRPVAFHGIDVPGGDAADGLSGAQVVFESVMAALVAADPADPLLRELDATRALLDPAGFTATTPRQRDRLAAAIAAIPARLARIDGDHARRPPLAAVDDARAAAVLLRMLRAWPAPADAAVPAAYRPVMAIRDAYMADAIERIAARRSRTFVYTHVGHAMATPIADSGAGPGGPTDRLVPMGMLLRARLGATLRIVAMVGGTVGAGLPQGGVDGTLDTMLGRVGPAPFFLDLTRAPHGWVDRAQSFRSNYASMLTAAPRSAFDAVIALDRLSAAARH